MKLPTLSAISTNSWYSPTGVRWLIAIFFALRLYGITNPPLDANHNWRQCTTNMYARNFLEVDNNPFYCRVDMAGDLSGITAKEFPLFNYLIYLVAEVVGWQHWYGRLISLVVSSLGICFFYLLMKNHVAPLLKIGPTASPSFEFSATLVLLCSIWFGHSRIIMPDTFAVSMVLAGLWFGLEWLHRGGWWRLSLFVLLATLGALSKLPAGFLLAALAFPILSKTIFTQRKIGIVAAGSLLLFCCGWWYFKWLPHVVETFGYEHYPMRSVAVGFWEILGDLPTVAERFYRSAFKSFVAFGLYLLGIGLAIWRRERLLLLLFGLLSLVFLAYMFKAGTSFYHHNYYIIPFVPVMAGMVGYAVSQINKTWLRNLLLLALAVESIANQQDAFRIKKKELPKLQLEAIADSLGNRADLVAFYAETGNPQELYFAHRKGWLLNAAQMAAPSHLDDLRKRGCKLIFIHKKTLPTEKRPNLPIVYEDDNYLVFKLLE